MTSGGARRDTSRLGGNRVVTFEKSFDDELQARRFHVVPGQHGSLDVVPDEAADLRDAARRPSNPISISADDP